MSTSNWPLKKNLGITKASKIDPPSRECLYIISLQSTRSLLRHFSLNQSRGQTNQTTFHLETSCQFVLIKKITDCISVNEP